MAEEFKTAHGLNKTKFDLEKKDSATKKQEDYLKRLREFFKKYKDNKSRFKRENKKLPLLPPYFLKKKIPLPSQLKKQMDEYKRMMRENKGKHFKKLTDEERLEGMSNQKTYAKGGGVRKVRY